MEKARRETIETVDAIYGFFGKYRFLSNYHLVNIEMPDGLTYPSSENAYQAYKTEDLVERKSFVGCLPSESKKLGNKVKLRPDWDKIKSEIMEAILRKKFSQPGLRAMLAATAPKYLEETNDWGDEYWGVCRDRGENHLGLILMKIRDGK